METDAVADEAAVPYSKQKRRNDYGTYQGGTGRSGSGVMADQWKDVLRSDPSDVLVVKGQKKVTGRSSNKRGDRIITNGSLIAVADGQCMLIVEQGDGSRRVR